MRFLVDTNLPPDLAVLLVSLGHDACHTLDVGLERATDRVIWQHAKVDHRCIVTRDEDFVLLSAADADGPFVVWVRIGNAVRRVILERVRSTWPTVVARLAAGEKVIELR